MSSELEIFQNSIYDFNRLPRKTLLLKWNATANDAKTIKLSLTEPFKVDVLSDVYLDSFTTFHSVLGAGNTQFDSPEKSAFVLNINEFNIQTNVASHNNTGNSIFNNILIPSDALSLNGNNNTTKTHKSKKMNYICSVNPCTLNNITGLITDLNKNDIFNQSPNDMFIAEFLFVARK